MRTLVEMHGGQIIANSRGVNQGSEFAVTLPLSKKVVDVSRIAPEVHLSVLPKGRVLVVDDNHDAAQSLGMLLKLLGADVRVVNDGPAALAILPSYRPTVVLLDIGMPGMDGYEVARRIRQQSEWQELMLIALTGWGQEDDRRRSTEAGFDHHLIKPADITALQTLFMSLKNTGEMT